MDTSKLEQNYKDAKKILNSELKKNLFALKSLSVELKLDLIEGYSVSGKSFWQSNMDNLDEQISSMANKITYIEEKIDERITQLESEK